MASGQNKVKQRVCHNSSFFHRRIARLWHRIAASMGWN